ncbi:MAG: ABC transporter transmembrane domain-containing protein, partial [Pseudomonadota bacterium]
MSGKTTQFMMASAALAAWFRENGEQEDVSASNPFLLNAPQSVWLVETGRVELFTVGVEDGEPVGTRDNFTSIEPGELMFGMDLDMYGMGSGFLAVGKLGTRLHKVDLEKLQALAQDPAMTLGLAGAIDKWVRQLSFSLTRSVPQPRVDVNMVHDEATVLEPEQKARANTGVLWVGGEQADLLYVGMEAIDLSVPPVLFPITVDSWVESAQARQEVELQGQTSYKALPDDKFWAGLEYFHETLCTCEFINKKLATVDEYNRLADKGAHSAEAREKAYGQIYAVMSQPGRRKRDIRIGDDEHPFGAACRLVGASGGIEVTVPDAIVDTPAVEERIQLVAKASRFRTRPVALQGDWYHFDQGPIVSQMDNDDAVALLPTSPTSYEYVIPATGERGEVDEKFNDRLAVFGAVFYRPFPDGPMTAGGLLKFGARGLRPDILMLLCMGVALGALGALTPMFTGMVFDQAIPQAERSLLVQFATALLIAALVSVVFTITQRIATLRIQGKMDYSIQAAVWDRLLDLPSRFFAEYEAGDLADRAGGINRIRGLLAGAGVSAILGSLSSVFYVVLLFVYSVPLALIAMGLTAIFVAFT